jgi:hypothetical protein
MKAIIDNNKTYKLILVKGSFYHCEDERGKSKCFEASKVELVEIDEMPKAKKYYGGRTAEEKRREKLSITAAREPLTFAEKEQLRKEMEAAKWASKSF